MNRIVVPYDFKPRPYQLDVLRYLDRGGSKRKRAFLMWHRRAGKDHLCAAYTFKEMVNKVGIYYYTFPKYSQGRKALWEQRDIMSMLPEFHNRARHGKDGCLIKSISNTEMKIELQNGSIFRIIGTDDIDSVVGTNPVGIVLSEYSLQDPTAWELLSPILAENNGWALINGTPRGRNFFFHTWNAVRNSKHWFASLVQTLYPDEPNYSGIVSPDMIQMERDSGKDEDTIAQEYGCSFSAAAKGAYYNDLLEKARGDGRIGAFPAIDSKWTETAWDLGVDDDTAVWFYQREGSKITLVDYYENRNKDIAHYVQMLQAKGYKYNTHHLPHDASHRSIQTGKTTADIFRDCLKDSKVGGAIDVVKRPASTQAAIDVTRHMFSRFYFNEGTTNKAIEMLSLYHRRYDPKRQVFMPQPVHDFTSHCADAFRCIAQSEEDYRDEYEDRIIIRTMEHPFDYD